MSPRRRPKRPDPLPIRGAVGSVLGELGHGPVAEAIRIASRWEAAVGAEVAAHAEPVSLSGSVLEVRVASSAWSHALVLRREALLAGLRRELGESAPRELRFRVGGIESGPMSEPQQTRDPEGTARPLRCDFCGAEAPSVRRIALDEGYDRLRVPHRERYACAPCSEEKERARRERS